MIPCSENIRRTNLPHLRHSFLHKGRDGRLVQLGGLHSPPIIILLTALMNNSVTSTYFWSTWTIWKRCFFSKYGLTCWVNPKDPRWGGIMILDGSI